MQQAARQAYERAIQRIGSLHGNMAVLARLDSLLKDERADLVEVERLMQSDGTLAGALVRLSNSALYASHAEPSEDVASALRKVGFDQAIRLVSLALGQQVFMRDLEAYGLSADDYWRYSYFSAVFMEGQAGRIGADPGEAYLLGLLHSIGRVVVNELLHVDEVEVLWDRFLPPSLWERAMVGFSSEMAGALLLQDWKFPESIYGRVARQVEKQAARSDPLLTLLHYTRHLAIHLDDPGRLEALAAPDAHLYVKIASLKPDEQHSAVATARARTEEVHTSLKGGGR